MDSYELSFLKDLDFSVLNINSKEKNCDSVFKMNVTTGRPLHGFLYVLCGRAEYTTIDSRKIVIKKNDILYLPKYCRYSSITGPTELCSYIIVNMDIIDNEKSEIVFANNLSILLSANNTYYRNIFKEINNTYLVSGTASRIKCKSLVYEMLYYLALDLYRNELSTNKYSKIYPSILFLEENYQTSISMKTLADVSHLSVSHFRKLFGEYFGVPPIEYINNLRIKKACELLKSGLYTVGETSERTGFSNVYYFSRIFKKLTGMSPKEMME